MSKRKRLLILLEVSAPADYPAAVIRREVRARVGEVRNWSWETADVKLIAARPAGRKAVRHG